MQAGKSSKVSRPCLPARMTRYPSLASAEVAEDSTGSGRSLSVGIRAKIRSARAADTMQSEYGRLETDYCAHPPRAVRQGSAGTARESLRKNQRRHGGVRTCEAVREFGAEL